MSISKVIAIGVIASCLGGCYATQDSVQMQAPAQQAIRPAAYPVDRLVGNWGIASYREEKDRARTEAMARSHCRNPYVITKGPRDGVMMHVADDAQVYELMLKGGADGKTYLGFNAPPGHDQDREILSITDSIVVMRFVNPEINLRYGTYIYVRCSQRA